MAINRFRDTTFAPEAPPRVSAVDIRRELSVSIQELVRSGLDKETINWAISCSQTMDPKTKQLATFYIATRLGDGRIDAPQMVNDLDTLQAAKVGIAEVVKMTIQLRRHWNGEETSTYV